jgi:hypothetical protein
MSAIQEAVDFLAELLSRGPVLAATVAEKAQSRGIAVRTLNRAKSDMGIEAFRKENPGPWYWQIPGFTYNGLSESQKRPLPPPVNPRSMREAFERLPLFDLLPSRLSE